MQREDSTSSENTSSQSDNHTTFLFTIMLGVGTDYAIFFMARTRRTSRSRDKAQAVQTPLPWSERARYNKRKSDDVIIAFGAMTLTSFTLLRSIGVGLELRRPDRSSSKSHANPSLILVAGDRIFWPTSAKEIRGICGVWQRKKRAERPGYFRRVQVQCQATRPCPRIGFDKSIPASTSH